MNTISDRPGLPPRQSGPSIWYGPDMARRTDWIESLDAGDIAEIDSAVAAANRRQIDVADLRRDDFPLPRLGLRLQRILRDVLDGRGFALLRGLPVERMSLHDAALAYFGIGTHFGNARSQNAKGHVLGHVKDMGLSSRDPNVRIYQTNERQTYHTDSCDIVGLLCLKTARSGGLSTLVSSGTIFNEMLDRRPDLLELLLQPLATDRRGEVPAGMKPYFEIPVFNWYAGALSAIYQRQYIDSAQRFADAPRLSPLHVEALDMFDDLANDSRLNLHMEFRPGDIQLVHNHVLLHDRTSFEDWPEPQRRRHLLRLWLAAPHARELPAVYAQRYGSVEIGNRGGIIVPGTVSLHAPLAAE